MAVAFSTTITIILLFFGRYLFGIFTQTEALIELAVKMMRIMAVGYICIAATQVMSGVMRGAGDTMTPMWISIFNTIILRMPLAYILAHFTASELWPKGHPFSLSISLVASWAAGTLLTAIAFQMGSWRKKARAIAEHSEARK